MATILQNAIQNKISSLYHTKSRQIFATLVRLTGSFDLAEEALHDAFSVAMERWPEEGVPDNPVSWLISAGRVKTIVRIRRNDTLAAITHTLLQETESQLANVTESYIEDDTLKLIFTCCHPSISPETQTALTLREVCGLTTEEIAHAFLTSRTTIAQRIVRGKQKIRESVIPFELPEEDELQSRLDNVLLTLYLIFNEGYNASSGNAHIRGELTTEAIYLTRQLARILNDAEVYGLLSLMLLHQARAPSRTDEAGNIVTLEHQQRAHWDNHAIAEGQQLLEQALATGHYGFYTLQAAIAFEHCRATHFNTTDWAAICGYYAQLQAAERSPVVTLNYAVAISMKDGAAAGLAFLDTAYDSPALKKYHLFHTARAYMLERMHRYDEAMSALNHARKLTTQRPELRFIEEKISTIQSVINN